ncbi:hypothetical protein HMPREF9194_01575 [Treponema maltophilum ATCC 51939]|uniref:Peroxiredoxin n=1 Tax=Treponema maltophilum ATCC 51939 TaxID=1125699 RepID=S3KG66_TREMA|nr:peroxiredoxin [Treponema maltophilum]EPF31232.1 hypothetical protein HMPREF9194_01575 [Treponema maltophilum ATCC 51939]
MENGMPLLGDKLPSLIVKTTHGVKHVPEDYKGRWLVLFSHPADFTPVCTTEFVSFQKHYDDFRAINCELLGLSIDQVQSHIKWTEFMNDKLHTKIEFPVIADDMGKVAEKLGMIHPGKGTNTVRAVFVIDPNGVLRLVIYYPQEIGRNMDEILRSVKALQTSDEHGVACPANWPNNELIQDQVIIPPASDETTAAERRGMANAFDWWFAYRKI